MRPREDSFTVRIIFYGVFHHLGLRIHPQPILYTQAESHWEICSSLRRFFRARVSPVPAVGGGGPRLRSLWPGSATQCAVGGVNPSWIFLLAAVATIIIEASNVDSRAGRRD